jgi:methylenetetrahydrofolate reductase (NADPH)
MLARLELLVKGPLYGCRMCGNCLLQETAYICPMQCPKGLRNGPCGGTAPGKCYVDETRPCIWHMIYDRAIRSGREETLLEVLPPLDWDAVGTETWGGVARQVRKVGTGSVIRGMLSRNAHVRSTTWDSVFRPLRQPEWWQGDAAYHPPAYTDSISDLERRLRSGGFVITTEVTPPLSADTDELKRKIELVKPYVAAVNFTDNSSASPRMSSIACCNVAHRMGAEPVLQIAARDKTRGGLQAEIVGANELGVRNVLCISGDSPRIGPPPTSSMNVFDLDSVQMLWILRRMRDEGKYLDGRKMKTPPRLFLGAAAAPCSATPRMQAIRDHKKINAGAQFFQTNLVFDTDALDRWLTELDGRGLLDKVFILAGIMPLKNIKTARYLHEKVPGVSIPDTVMTRMERAGDGESEEGIQIALEIVDSLIRKPGINGIHLMTLGCESTVRRIATEAGILQKPFDAAAAAH